MEDEEEESSSKLKRILVVLLIVALSGGLIWFINVMLATPIEPPKKTVQEIKIIRPPPPPPEVEEEPPPPPEEEDVEIPEDEPDIPDISEDLPSSEQLGLDAEGGAGGDAFGLVGKKGGRGLIGSGVGDRNIWYAGNVIKPAVLDKLIEAAGVLALKYRIRLNLWVSESGEVTRFKLLETTGDPDIDRTINTALASLNRLKTLPPPNMPQPVRLEIVAR